MANDLTFAVLERAEGQNYSPSKGDKWPLEEWYDAVREIPIAQLSVRDLARAGRQNVWIEHIVPLAVSALRENPQAGDLYDGELVVALTAIPQAYWVRSTGTASELKAIVESSWSEFDQDLQEETKNLLTRIG